MSEVQIDRSQIKLVKPIKLPGEVSDLWKELYLEPIYRWLPVVDEVYQKWPERPNAGHFYGGSYWYGHETAYPTLVLAVAYRAAQAWGQTGAIPTDRLLQQAIGGIRYLGFTHMSGPEDCVRAEGPNPHCSLRKWGEASTEIDPLVDAFFMSTQTSGSIAAMGVAAWLLWDKLDDETRQLVINTAQWYADRWCDEQPHVGTYSNTQTEENGWTAQGLDFAACLLHGHPHAEQWRQAADRWIANICVTPYDCRRNASELQGRPVSDWTVGATTHPDFTAENHDFVHPNYMSSGVVYAGKLILFHHLAGLEVPEVLYFNRQPLYNTVKAMAEDDGALTSLQSQDWWYLTHYGNLSIHATVNVLLHDPHAAYLERTCGRRAKQIMNSLPGGHIYTQSPDAYRINAFQSMRTAERGSMAAYAHSLLLHWMLGDGAEPCTRAAFKQYQQGVKVFPHGGFVVRNGAATKASFSWRNRPVVLVQPAAGSWLVTPHRYSLSGSYTCDPEWAGGTRKRSYNVQEDGAAFAAIARLERQGGRLLQDLALLVPDDNVAFFFDHTTATEPVTVSLQRSGEIGVRNESYSELGELAPGKRTLYTQGCEFTAVSGLSEHDEWFRSDATAWANLDNAIGYLVFGSKGLAYQAKHVYPRYTGMEDFLILSCYEKPRDYQPEEVVSHLAIAIYPNQTAEATRSQLGLVLRTVSDGPVDALLTPEHLALINTADAPVTCSLQFDPPDWEMLPVPEGCTVTWDGALGCALALGKYCAELRGCRLQVASSVHWEATATAGGRRYLKLLGAEPAQVEVAVDGKKRTVSLEPGQIVEL